MHPKASKSLRRHHFAGDSIAYFGDRETSSRRLDRSRKIERVLWRSQSSFWSRRHRNIIKRSEKRVSSTDRDRDCVKRWVAGGRSRPLFFHLDQRFACDLISPSTWDLRSTTGYTRTNIVTIDLPAAARITKPSEQCWRSAKATVQATMIWGQKGNSTLRKIQTYYYFH